MADESKGKGVVSPTPDTPTAPQNSGPATPPDAAPTTEPRLALSRFLATEPGVRPVTRTILTKVFGDEKHTASEWRALVQQNRGNE